MHVVPVEPQVTEAPYAAFVGTPLSVVFAEGEAIEAVRSAGRGSLPLAPPYHVSDDDAYLVLPDDIGMEIVDIVADGDLELLHEALRDGLLVVGTVGKSEEDAGEMTLEAEEAHTPAEALKKGLPYAATVEVGSGIDPVQAVNALEHVQCTVVSALFDDDGLEKTLRRKEQLGMSWRVPADAAELSGVDPTYVWSKRLGPGEVGVELALFLEYEELAILLRPVKFRAV